MIYAEVIGDPIAQSKSPLIHRHWLERLGMEGDYRARRVPPAALGAYLAERRPDPDWRGCNVTIPHKQAVLPLLDAIDEGAAAIGAVNLVAREGERLTGGNSDIDGVAAALAGTALHGRHAAMIGAGGGARAALAFLRRSGARVTILVRDPAKAAPLGGDGVGIRPLGDADAVLGDAACVVNASPMGMEGAAAMPDALLTALSAHARGRTFFDMVYKPLETPFLAAGRANGARVVDGLAMLIGQARAAFAAFFGAEAPEDEAALRAILTRQ